MSEELTYAGARELGALYGSRKASPVEVVRSVLAAIDRWNPIVNAYCFIDHEAALEQAAQSERRWGAGEAVSPVDGIPFGVKDLLLARGCPTGYGSLAARKLEASVDDAPAVARLREAGAVVIGKTTTSEFGWKGTADSPLTGVTRNVWDTTTTSGGSSGGASCAAAAGLGTFQLGTDGGGSVRIPASFCGVVGMKATFGRIPAWPPGPMLTLSNVGAIARSIDDLGLMFRFVSMPDRRDWYSVPSPREQRDSVTGLRDVHIGVHFADHAGHLEVNQAIRKVADRLADLGARVEETSLPLSEARELIDIHWKAGAAWLVGSIPESRWELVDKDLIDAARRGSSVSLTDYYRAMVRRQHFGEAMERHVSRFDAILTPTVPVLPFDAGRQAPVGAPSEDWLDWNPFTYPFNLTRQPAISMPAGFSSGGLPIGMQLVGKLYDDAWLIDLAKIVESSLEVVGSRRPQLPG